MTQKNDAPTILIVDDTPSNLGMVVKLMEDRGYRVSIAQDGEEGLQRAQLLQPDLILLDVMMPGADGFEICQRLKALERTRDIPVMFMTALASPEHKVKGFAAGGVDYLTKPLHVDEVMARVDTHIKLNTAQRQLEIQNALLEKQRDELEMRVEERTAELGEANRRLREESAERERAYRRMVLLDFALDHVTEDVSLLDQNGMFQYVNEHACREMGLSRSKLQSMGVADIDPDWTTERYAEFWPELQRQGAIRLETHHQSSDGKIFPVEVDANYFEYEGVGYNLTLVRNISERKAAEAALRASEREFRTLAENLPDNLARYDKQCRIVYMNPQLESFLHTTLEEKQGTTPLESAPGPIYVEYQARMAETIATGQPSELELTLPDSGTGIRYHHIRFVAERDERGEIIGALAIGRDITEQKEAERLLYEQEQAIRAVVENSPDAIARYDNQLRRIYVNPATQKLFDLPLEQIQGKTPEDYSPMTADFIQIVREVFESGRERQIELPFRKANGEAGWGDLRIVPEFGADGSVVSVLSIGRDITARKQMEEELREQELRYREIFDNASDGLFLLEVTEDGRFRNLDLNPAFLKMTGMSREQLIGKCVDETVPPETAQIVTAKYRRCLAVDAPIVEETELDLPIGKRYYHSTLVPVHDGSPRRIVGITRDITEIKLVERSLEESRAQLRGLAAKNEAEREEEHKYIARTVFDELGQTLAGLQLDVSALSQQFGGDLPALREHLNGTRELVNKSFNSLRNISAMLRPSSLDMGIVHAIEWVAGRFSDNTGIACEVHISDKDRDVKTDEKISVALYRIVHELLTNVSRHAKASRVEVSFGLKGRDYVLEVKDNGSGFDVGNIKEGAFGLLDIRERTHRLGGQLAIASTPGKGTEIKVSIPSL